MDNNINRNKISYMSFESPTGQTMTELIPARSLYLMSGPSRYKW